MLPLKGSRPHAVNNKKEIQQRERPIPILEEENDETSMLRRKHLPEYVNRTGYAKDMRDHNLRIVC